MEDLQNAADWWAENHQRYWATRRVLLTEVQSNGPIQMSDGRLLGWFADGQEWDSDEVMAIMPQLIKHAEVTFEGPRTVIERVIEQVMETEHEAQLSNVKRTVDKSAANGVIRAGGEAAEKLSACKIAKNKLAIR